MQKSKMAVVEDLEIAVKRREVKSKGEKERYTHLNEEFQKNSKEREESFPQKSMKRNARRQNVCLRRPYK